MALTGCGDIPRASSDIAFMGVSITDFWFLPKTNYGVSGNTTQQMLVRFPDQVIGHGYRAVVILGGTNDVRKTNLPVETEVTRAIANLATMAEQAEKDGLVVVLCTLPPIRNQNQRVVPMNEAIEALAGEHNYKLVDYYNPMLGHPEYFRDGLHPSDLGYFVMQKALTKVLPLNY